ncbi:carboxylesterase/lipase family protein [Streptomyces sp. NPDC056716]|uniref:carboxylesterase/lipase family protein n=1 Tax=unclassified Streptomyces TaxID=2593676 RepID=UPI0036CE7AD7
MSYTLDPVTRTTGGRVRGATNAAVVRYRSVPYAAPPVGALRFAAPAPHPPWDGVRDATRLGPTAPQRPRSLPGLDLTPIIGTGWRTGDDYLTVDVWTPDPGSGGLPVLVFLHGGAFVAGTASAPATDGTAFARDGVVVVAMNYRIGAEGFLPLSGGVTNAGLRDQIAGLEWVRENIAAFGGDPGNITLVGHSAGAVCAGALLESPRASGLFRRAVLQSGGFGSVRGPAEAWRLSAAVADELGVVATARAMREIAPEDLLAAQAAVAAPGRALDLRDPTGHDPGHGMLQYLPFLDDDLLPSNAATAPVDVLIGNCAEEMNAYLVPPGVTASDEAAPLVARLGASHPHPEEVLKQYGLGDGRPAGTVLAEALTDLAFRAPARRYAAAHADRTHCYEFSWPSPLFEGRLGACHGIELPFVFDTLPTAGGPDGLVGDHPPHDLARRMHRAWTRFATDGDPGWPVHGLTGQVAVMG